MIASVPNTIDELEGEQTTSRGRPDVPETQMRYWRFWESLLSHANRQSDLHEGISPCHRSWISKGRHSLSWNYVVLRDKTRAELYVNKGTAEDNKALFDFLHAERLGIEPDFGGRLTWQRLDDKRASRISFSVPGGWGDEGTWPTAIEHSVGAMQRLYAALAPRVLAASGSSD